MDELYDDLKSIKFLIYILGAIVDWYLLCNGFFWFDNNKVTLKEFMPILLLFILFMIIIGCLSNFLLNFIANKRLTKKFKLLENCKVKEFIEYYEKLLQKCESIVNKKYLKYNLILNLSMGYIDYGKPEEALKILLSIETIVFNSRKFNSKRYGNFFQILFYNNLVAAYLLEGNIEKSEEILGKFKEILENSNKVNKVLKIYYYDLYEEKEIIYNIKKQNYENAEYFCNKKLKLSDTILQKVKNNYWLANIYIHFNDKEKAKSCIDYVLENGGDTYYKKEFEKI